MFWTSRAEAPRLRPWGLVMGIQGLVLAGSPLGVGLMIDHLGIHTLFYYAAYHIRRGDGGAYCRTHQPTGRAWAS